MDVFKRNRTRTKGNTIYSKGDTKANNQARWASNSTIDSIMREKRKRKYAENPRKKILGPRVLIIKYIKFMKDVGGIDVTDENIIEHMKKIMPKLEREYIQTLIEQIRRTDINIHEPKGRE